MTETRDIWNELNSLGLVTQDISDTEAFEELMQNNQTELKELLDSCEDTEYIANLTFDEMMKLPYTYAQTVIKQFSMAKRIEMLDQLNTHRDFYYEQTSRFHGTDKENMISAKDFRSLLGKIKHLEILQNWLYGID